MAFCLSALAFSCSVSSQSVAFANQLGSCLLPVFVFPFQLLITASVAAFLRCLIDRPAAVASVGQVGTAVGPHLFCAVCFQASPHRGCQAQMKGRRSGIVGRFLPQVCNQDVICQISKNLRANEPLKQQFLEREDLKDQRLRADQ